MRLHRGSINVSTYAYNKRWRMHHPSKRYKGKSRYYARHRDNPQNSRNARQEWTISDLDRITAEDRPPDSILAKQLGRSVAAVHIMRCKLKKKV